MNRRPILTFRILLIPALLVSTAMLLPGCTALRKHALAERSPVIQPERADQPAASLGAVGENDE